MSFTSDATSGMGIPQNATEWGDAALSPYFGVPKNLWLLQEASGNVADSIGAVTLSKTGTPTYQNAVAGWTTKAIHVESPIAGGDGFVTTSSTIDPTAKSQMWLAYVRVTGAPASGRTNVVCLGGLVSGAGTSSTLVLSINATPRLSLRSTATAEETLGTKDPTNVVIAILVQYDITRGLYRCFTTQERIDAAFDSPTLFNGAGSKGLGTIQSNPRSGPFDMLYLAHWDGADAEIKSWQARLGLDALGWNASGVPAFNVTFEGTMSESLSESESIAVATSAIVGLAESESESESISVAISIPTSISDSLSIAESMAARFDAIPNMSEAVSTAESIASKYDASQVVSDSFAESESIAVVHDTSQALADSLATSESLLAQYQPSAMLSEAYVFDESVATSIGAGLNFWGPLFPGPSKSYFGPLFPVYIPLPSVAVAVGPAGVATFAIDLLSGFKVRFAWRTDIIKAWDGTERQRVSQWSLPRQVYSGQAYLIGTDTRAIRSRLARYAAQGKPFLLGLAYEEATVTSDSFDDEVDVADTAVLDWAVLGQRILIIDVDGNAVGAVIQRVSPTQFGLDIAPGEVARRGSRVMPAFPIFLEPQQTFARYPNPDGVEAWSVDARAIMFGFEQLGTPAFVVLVAYTSGHLIDSTAVFAIEGIVGNGLTLTFVAGSAFDHGQAIRTGASLVFHFKTGVTTILDAINALRTFSVALAGGFLSSTVLLAGVDEFGPAVFVGGSDRIFGNMGNGATLTYFSGQYVWDKRLQLDGADTVADLVQSMTDIVDFSAILFDVQEATQPDWGRGVAISSDDPRDWQWLKKFLSTVQGRRRIFRLPSWRADLDVVSVSPGVIVIRGPSEADGDFFAWYPDARQFIQVLFADDFVLYCFVRDATDNMDGTITLDVNTSDPDYDEGGSATPRTDAILTSWLESARFESDDFDVTWEGHIFSMRALARVVR